MRFEDYINKKQVKIRSKDVILAKSLLETAQLDLKYLKSLTITEISARKITANYYDILRSLAEALAALDGYKVYSHEAFTYYLKEFVNNDSGNKFDRFRKIRNNINYYGKTIEKEESENIIKSINLLINLLIKKIKEKLGS